MVAMAVVVVVRMVACSATARYLGLTELSALPTLTAQNRTLGSDAERGARGPTGVGDMSSSSAAAWGTLSARCFTDTYLRCHAMPCDASGIWDTWHDRGSISGSRKINDLLLWCLGLSHLGRSSSDTQGERTSYDSSGRQPSDQFEVTESASSLFFLFLLHISFLGIANKRIVSRNGESRERRRKHVRLSLVQGLAWEPPIIIRPRSSFFLPFVIFDFNLGVRDG